MRRRKVEGEQSRKGRVNRRVELTEKILHSSPSLTKGDTPVNEGDSFGRLGGESSLVGEHGSRLKKKERRVSRASTMTLEQRRTTYPVDKVEIEAVAERA